MKLSEIRDAYEEISGKLSDINRQLCFAGFAIIWIFNKTDNDISVPTELYLPALLLCASLFLIYYNMLYQHLYGMAIIYASEKRTIKTKI